MLMFLFQVYEKTPDIPHITPPNTLHIDVQTVYYAIGIAIALGTILWRIYTLFNKAIQHADSILVIAREHGERLRDNAVADRKVWVSEHLVEHTRLISDQKVMMNEIQNEIDAVAEKHDTDMHQIRKTMEAVLLEKRDLEGLMRQVRDEITTLNARIENLSNTLQRMNEAVVKNTERIDTIKAEHNIFHKGEKPV